MDAKHYTPHEGTETVTLSVASEDKNTVLKAGKVLKTSNQEVITRCERHPFVKSVAEKDAATYEADYAKKKAAAEKAAVKAAAEAAAAKGGESS
jgi:type IV secretory pathway VirB9-like protein